MKYLNEAVDNARRQETSQLKKDGYEPILEKSRWCWLRNKKNRKKSQIKEAFQHLWTYKTHRGAERYFKEWSTKIMRSRLPEIKKVVKSLRKHQELLLNYFFVKERLSNSIVEGFNLKAKLTMRKSSGFRMFETIEVALYHTLGYLPEPPVTHKFC